MRLSRPAIILEWIMIVAFLALAFAVTRDTGTVMWKVFRVAFVLLWLAPGPITAVWGLVVVVRRKTWLTRRPVITGKPAIALGIVAMVAGLAYAPLLIYWVTAIARWGW